MNNFYHDKLNSETKRRYLLTCFFNGLKSIIINVRNAYLLICILMVILLIWNFRLKIFNIDPKSILSGFYIFLTNFSLVVWSILIILITILLFGTPKNAFKIRNNLQRAGLVNHIGEAPLLIESYSDPENANITILEFDSSGIPKSDWIDKQPKIETALNLYIVKIKDGSNNRRLLVYTVDANFTLPEFVQWQESLMSNKNFELMLGVNFLGYVTVNLANIPHLLIGGSTGSGKTVLLKLLLMQASKKGAEIYIADFKGGVDFSPIWHEKCNICTDEKTLLNQLNAIVDELHRRQTILRESGFPDIDTYNESTGNNLKRIIFACDEVAELLDKSGLSKNAKDEIIQIEGKISSIARLGRASGIHLFLATQRPDATIINGQIRNNINFRACGRADKVLSQIILDTSDAADQIPKDARGRFILHDGTVFQAFWFDEHNL